MHLKPSIDFPLANTLLTSALSRSLELGARVSIAVADHAGELIAFARMDGARSFTIDLAMEKARAAAKLAIPRVPWRLRAVAHPMVILGVRAACLSCIKASVLAA